MIKKFLLLCAIACTSNTMELIKIIMARESLSTLKEACKKGDFQAVARCRTADKYGQLAYDTVDSQSLITILPFLADYENGEAHWLLKELEINSTQPLEALLRQLHTKLIVDKKADKSVSYEHRIDAELTLGFLKTKSPGIIAFAFGNIRFFEKFQESLTELVNFAIKARSVAALDWLQAKAGTMRNGLHDHISTQARDLLLDSKELRPQFVKSLLKSFVFWQSNKKFLFLSDLIRNNNFDVAIHLYVSDRDKSFSPDQLSYHLIRAIQMGHPPALVAAIVSKMQIPFSPDTNGDMPLHHAVRLLINPPDHRRLSSHFRIRKIMAIINEYAPDGAYSQEEIEANLDEHPEDEWNWAQQREASEYDGLVVSLKKDKPSRFELGLPSEADCLAIMKTLLEADHSDTAIQHNHEGYNPMLWAAGRGNIIDLIYSYYPNLRKK